MAELSRCLRLTAPAGMSDIERREWLVVALPEVEFIPSVEFFPACSHARKVADHPSKIIPAIHAYKPEFYARADFYRARLNDMRQREANINAKRLEHRSEPKEPEMHDFASLIAKLGEDEE